MPRFRTGFGRFQFVCLTFAPVPVQIAAIGKLQKYRIKISAMGRNRVPTNLRILRGNPSKTPINKDEPRPPAGPLTPPPEITGPLADLWEELSAPLLAMGCLTVADTAGFAKLVHLEYAMRELSKTMATDTTAAREFVRLATLALRLYDRYGMTPSARANLTVNKPANDPLRDFLAAGG